MSEHLLEIDDRRFLWHPFTQMAEWEEETPLVIEHGEGAVVYDIHGREYLDGVSSLWVNAHGHRHPTIDEAIRRQLDAIAHSTLLGLANVPSVQLARKLVEITPHHLTRVFFSDNGSTAVEIALKMAFQFQQQTGETQRTQFVSFHNAYHGDTIGSVSVGGIDLFHATYKPMLFKSLKAQYPYCYRCYLGKSYPECELACRESIEEILAKNHENVAAVIIEPLVQGAGGMVTSPPGFLSLVRDLCNRYGILLILDEVATGFGRTGRMFALEHEGVEPDFLCLAKAITGGYLPLAATLTTDQVYQAFCGEYSEFKTFFHGHSYTGNPLACAAALANLEIFEKEKTLDHLKEKIDFLGKLLESVKDLPHVGDIRRSGFMVGIELVKDRATREPYPYAEKIGAGVCLKCREKGVILRPLGNVVVLMPPLCITHEQLEKLVEVTTWAIGEITS